jgi:hypothetical protein
VKSVAGPVKMAVSPTPDPKEREEERARHRTFWLSVRLYYTVGKIPVFGVLHHAILNRGSVLYSWKIVR